MRLTLVLTKYQAREPEFTNIEACMKKNCLLLLGIAAFFLVTGDSGSRAEPDLNLDGGGGRPCTSSNTPICPPGIDAKDHSYFASNFSTSESVTTSHARAV